MGRNSLCSNGSMSCGGVSPSVLDSMKVLVLWIYLMAFTQFSGVMSELCSYQKSMYNRVNSNFDKISAHANCQWGCCYHRTNPCCETPISLIIGCVLGGIAIFTVLLVAICCCCVRRQRRIARQQRQVVLDPGGATDGGVATYPSSVVYHSESSGQPPHYDTILDSPPSYEEVMRGESNQAFKPD